jgi:hypothetical protein
MPVPVLHLLALLALDLTAIAVVVCCLRLRDAHAIPLRRRERALLIAAALAVVGNGMLGRDLALTALVDLAVLLAVVAPVLSAASAER